jgi:CheY-like chemotaxis protein
MKKVLCIDDDETVALMVSDYVKFFSFQMGWDLTPVIETSSMKAVGLVTDPDIVCLICDYNMPHLDGVDVLTVWQDSRPRVRRLLITASPQQMEVLEAKRTALVEMVISKPVQQADMKLALAWL